MSFDLPASVERDLERYAQAEHISPAEAAVRIIQDALNARRRGAATDMAEGVDWDKYRQLVPGVELFEQLPEGTVEDIAKSSRLVRAQKLTPRA